MSWLCSTGLIGKVLIVHHVLTRLAIATIGYIICALKRQQSLNFHVNMCSFPLQAIILPC